MGKITNLALTTIIALGIAGTPHYAHAEEKKVEQQEEKSKEKSIEERIKELECDIKKDSEKEVKKQNADLCYELGILYETRNKEDDKKLYEKWINKGIEIDMKKDTVQDILHNMIESKRIVPIEKTKDGTNFKELVYQEKLKKEDRKAGLMYVDRGEKGKTETDEKYALGKRLSILHKITALKNPNLNMWYFEANIEKGFDASKKDWVFGKDLTVEGVTGLPSLVMYSPWDITKKETKEKNNNKIKNIDLLKGGPNKDTLVMPWLDFLNNNWIPTNQKPNKEKYAWRFNNSLKEKKVKY